MSSRWARTALCTLAVASATLLGTAGAGARGLAVQAGAGAPPLVLTAQTPWVTPTQPWFNLSLAVADTGVPAADLHVSLTFYSRTANLSQFEQAVGAVPQKTVLLRVPDVAVGQTGQARTAVSCVTVLPDESATVPAAPAGGACAAGSAQPPPTLVLGCTPDTGECGDVYPVSVALFRQGVSTAVARFTTFLTYQEPQGPERNYPSLRVGVITPVSGGGAPSVVGALAAHHDVPVTVDVSPRTAAALQAGRTRGGGRTLAQLADLGSDEMLAPPFVPVNIAALSEAGIAGEIQAQVTRGTELLRTAGLRPTGGTWVDTAASFAQGDAANLASGLQVVGDGHLVLSDADLASAGSTSLTFAQPFTLDLGHGNGTAAAATNAPLSALFGATPADPVLGADQLLAGLSFVHFENPFKSDPRGVLIAPPPAWRPSGTFMDTLLTGLTQNPALTPVTLSGFFAQVPVGGNGEPATRRLQAGGAAGGITRTAAAKIAIARQQLASWCCSPNAAVSDDPAELTSLSDALLTTEAQGLSPARRATALNAYSKSFDDVTGEVTLATERTVTFTAQRAPIPITVLSSAPYPVRVVVTLNSDKFSFPDGNTRELTLNRPTTSVRVTAQARTSGDRLPIDVTLRTPDGQLILAHTVLTVQSTAISFVGVALTVLAGAVLLAWWVRTWRRSRRLRPRAH